MRRLLEKHPLLFPLLLLRRHWAQTRFRLFLMVMQPADGSRILDLGGGDGAFFHRHAAVWADRGFRITVADINRNVLVEARRRGFDVLHIGEHDLRDIPAHSFDIVFSNSVIEHVTVDKEDVWHCMDDKYFISLAEQHQAAFANDIRRLGRGYFVQTPHPDFPVESHTWLPFSLRLSRRALIYHLRFFNRWWIKKTSPDFHLLTEKRMAGLFPDAARVMVRRVLGFKKEIIAYKPAE